MMYIRACSYKKLKLTKKKKKKKTKKKKKRRDLVQAQGCVYRVERKGRLIS
ncbi:hypothetical protein Pyrfu_1214 [Pyrolobus fumarii 1A]|uniref:Uncharacterized protein n=1 Tax=Pyrolobus fumarii (strain DSM 11204 / 1A) TaxID=694429 RepID=G0EFX5_PYRF1|nr:hypothetical protein Pyrfu_1214 [Pyrolobus fumarii 1A]